MTSKSTVKRVAAQKEAKVEKAWQEEPIGDVEKVWKAEEAKKETPSPKKAAKVKDFISCGDCDAHNEPGTAYCKKCGNEL